MEIAQNVAVVLIALNPTGSNHFETFFYARNNEERDRLGRYAGRLAPHFPGQDVFGETPNTACGTHALPIPIRRFLPNESKLPGQTPVKVSQSGSNRLLFGAATQKQGWPLSPKAL